MASTYPTTADAINDTDDPSVVMSSVIDGLNAVQNDLIAIGSTSVVQAAKVISSATAFVSGTAYKNTNAYSVTATIATATAGSAVIAVSKDGVTFSNLVSGRVLATTDVIIVPDVRPGWSVKVTLTTSTGAADWVVY